MKEIRRIILNYQRITLTGRVGREGINKKKNYALRNFVLHYINKVSLWNTIISKGIFRGHIAFHRGWGGERLNYLELRWLLLVKASHAVSSKK